MTIRNCKPVAAALSRRYHQSPGRTSTLMGALVVPILALIASGVSAHHPISGKFDTSSSRTLAGTVTAVDWRNPHAHVFINVGTGADVLNWAVELESPVKLRRSGWSAQTLQPGDAISVTGITARDGTRQIWGESVVVSGTGREVYTVTDKAPPLPLNPRPIPRWPDGKPALGAIPGGVDGYWSYPSSTALVEDGVEIEMNEYGLLANIRDAGRVAPMQDWAEAIYRHRQSRQLRDDPMYLECKPPGGPRQYQSDLGIKFAEDKTGQRVFALLGSGNSNYRIMYLDGREATGQVGGDDDNPLYYGRSVGAWDGDTLVVETTGFNEDFWFTNGGLPHTSQLRLVERFTRMNQDTLHYEVTVDDRGAYTRPWSSSWTLRWIGAEELPQHLCQENRP